MQYEEQLAAFAAAAEQDLARLLMSASRALNSRTLAQIDPEGGSGVRVAHVPVIAALDGAGTRVVDLARRVGHTRQAVAALVRDLEAAGMVEVAQDPEDRRASRVVLTAAGAAFCARATAVLVEREARWRLQWGEARVEDLRTMLRELAQEDQGAQGA